MMSSKFLSRSANALKNGVARRQQTLAPRTLSTTTGVSGRASALPIWAVTGATATFLAVSFATNNKSSNVTKLERRSSKGLPVVMFGEPQEEADTGIMFPPMVNGFTLMGCGVRIKYVFVKVYAVGAYLRPEDFKGMKDDAAIEKKLLDPSCHKTIRIVMNRSMTMDKYNDAIVEALKPRMNGQDMDKLEEFKKLNPPGPLEKDTELLMTIRGDTLLYKNASGNVGTIHSEVFCKAMCDVYFGSDPASPKAKQNTINAIKKM